MPIHYKHSTVFSKIEAIISQARKMKSDGQCFAQGFIVAD